MITEDYMSRIYFHNIEDEATVRGSERAHFGVTINHFAWAFLDGLAFDFPPTKPSMLRSIFPPGHHVHQSNDFERDAEVTFNVGFEDYVLLHGRKVELFGLKLNTALALGNDVLKLAARLHGQCEIHTYVEGENRAWLASIIEQGRASGFLRPDMGWESVISLLRQSDDSPVITSYSVTEQFPNPVVADYDPPLYDDGEQNWDAWYDLPDDVQWEMALDGLRKKSAGLELTPKTWDRFVFNDGMNICQFVNELLR